MEKAVGRAEGGRGSKQQGGGERWSYPPQKHVCRHPQQLLPSLLPNPEAEASHECSLDFKKPSASNYA